MLLNPFDLYLFYNELIVDIVYDTGMFIVEHCNI